MIAFSLSGRQDGEGKTLAAIVKDRAPVFLKRPEKKEKAMAQRGRKSLAATTAVSLPALAEKQAAALVHLSDQR